MEGEIQDDSSDATDEESLVVARWKQLYIVILNHK